MDYERLSDQVVQSGLDYADRFILFALELFELVVSFSQMIGRDIAIGELRRNIGQFGIAWLILKKFEHVSRKKRGEAKQELLVRDLSLLRVMGGLSPDRLKLTAWVDLRLLEEVPPDGSTDFQVFPGVLVTLAYMLFVS